MSSTLPLRTNSEGGAVSIGIISPSDAVGTAAAGGSDSNQLQHWLWASGFVTLVLDARTLFYISPHGVVFGQHRFAYYATLAGIFAAGLAKVGRHRLLAGQLQPARPSPRSAVQAGVVCAVVPLVAIIALGGFPVVMKG